MTSVSHANPDFSGTSDTLRDTLGRHAGTTRWRYRQHPREGGKTTDKKIKKDISTNTKESNGYGQKTGFPFNHPIIGIDFSYHGNTSTTLLEFTPSRDVTNLLKKKFVFLG